ncbi:MAG: hypothetical protein H6505_02580 [Calditrichaeota bacterium]|nr:hypothetical protein [Calditrichota bacterium]
MRFRSGNSQRAALIASLLILLGCSRVPETVRIDTGRAEQIFTPRLSKQESGELNCQWVEFHTDSIGGADCAWNSATGTFDKPESYDFIDRRWVQCIPQLDRFHFANHGTATLVAHSCIQEAFIVFRDSTDKREAAWLAAPAVLTYPIPVDSLFLILYESPLDFGLICVWLDRGARELSRDTLDLPSPEFATASAGGVMMVKAEEDRFRIFHMAPLCSWVDSTSVARSYPAKQQFGTDYFASGDNLFIVSGYRKAESNEQEIETHVFFGTQRESQHNAAIKRESVGKYVAFRAVDSGREFPYLLALEEDAEQMRLTVLGVNNDGYWSRMTPRVDVSPTIQEFTTLRDQTKILAAYTAATSDTLPAADACYSLQFNLE